MDNPLIGVCLVGETESSSSHVIGAVYLPPSSRTQNLRDFRRNVNVALPRQLGTKNYVFLTSNGWEINENLESTVKVSNVLTSDGMIRVRICYAKPRIGIAIEGIKDTPIGFVFCDIDISIQQLTDEIKTQLPLLHQNLSATNFCFIDRNGWPISKEQEGLLTVLEISSSCTVRIRCDRQGRRVSSHGQIGDWFPEVVLPLRSISSHPVPGSLLQVLPDPNSGLSPVVQTTEKMEASVLDRSMGSEIYYDSMRQSSTTNAYEILISYVHNEASDYVAFLKEALEKLGYSVFLDTHCIQGGTDWQDTLNDAISNCSLFVPLISLQYGQTLWTNREVKLADVLGKIIIPVNFLDQWPPKCLAIQFATTQFIAWKRQSSEGSGMTGGLDEETADSVALDISQRYQQELKSSGSMEEMSIEGSQSTEIIMEDSPTTPALQSPSPMLLRKKSTLKSYASNLPVSLPATYRKSIQESRLGKPLVVISCHSAQREFVQGLVSELESKDYEVWCSADIETCDEEEARKTFQERVDEAGVVVFLLSKDFEKSALCEQQVYYCEQRKRIVPLIYEPMQLPPWMAMLVGTSTFIDCRASSYKTTLLERIETSLNPIAAALELKDVQKQKTEISKMCSKLSGKLPKGMHVYISGGTKFFSPSSEEICKELGRLLAQDQEIILVTGGFYGVGETVGRSFHEERQRLKKPHGVCHVIAVKDDQDKSLQTRQNKDGTFPPLPYGDTLFFGDSVRQRETLTPKVLSLCILIEGGPGAAFEAQQFTWNGNMVIPIKVTGGAAGGSFNVPEAIFKRPPNVTKFDWALLSEKKAPPHEIAAAVVRIVHAVNSDIVAPKTRKNASGWMSTSSRFRRSGTMPVDVEGVYETKAMKRTHSESRSPVQKQKSLTDK